MNTKPIHGEVARKKILKGVELCYDIVKKTLGPEGKNALLPRTYNRGPRITNDGITILENAIKLKDPYLKLVAEAFAEGSRKTNQEAGDGTSTTAIIGGVAIIDTLRKLSEYDAPTASVPGMKAKEKTFIGVRALRKEMKDAKDLIIEEIKNQSKPIKTLKELEKIAVVSIGKEDNEIAKAIAKMTWQIARDKEGNYVDNHIDVQEGFKGRVETEIIQGMRFPAKIPAKAFVNKPEGFEMVCEDVPILVTNYKFDSVPELINLLNNCKKHKLAIFAESFSNAILLSIIQHIKKGFMLYPIKIPALRTEQLQDLATYTGSTLIDKKSGKKISNIEETDLGFAEKIVVKDVEAKEDATLIGGKGENIKRGSKTLIQERQDMLRKQVTEARTEMVKLQLGKRIANLSSAIGVIRVASSTSSEGLYLKLKIEDGVHACKAALQEGYVKGGGICLRDVAKTLPKNVLTEVIQTPYNQIQHNAGGNLEIGADIIDPTKVVRLSMEHGISIASTMITTDILIPDIEDTSPGDGYEAIAKAINLATFYEAKHKSQLSENQKFEDDKLQEAFDQAEAMDKD